MRMLALRSIGCLVRTNAECARTYSHPIVFGRLRPSESRVVSPPRRGIETLDDILGRDAVSILKPVGERSVPVCHGLSEGGNALRTTGWRPQCRSSRNLSSLYQGPH